MIYIQYQEVMGIERCPECQSIEFHIVKSLVDPRQEGKERFDAFNIFCAKCGTLYMYVPHDTSVAVELTDQAQKLDIALEEAKYFKKQLKLAYKRLGKYESVEKKEKELEPSVSGPVAAKKEKKKSGDNDGDGKGAGPEEGAGQ